jgi:hypothetical protein
VFMAFLSLRVVEFAPGERPQGLAVRLRFVFAKSS